MSEAALRWPSRPGGARNAIVVVTGSHAGAIAMARAPRRVRWRRLRLPVIASALWLALITDTIAFADRAIYGDWVGKTSGDKLTMLLNLLMMAVTGWLFWRRWRLGGRLIGGEKLLLALGGLLFVTALWSVDPQVTVRRAVLYVAFLLGTIGVASALDGDEIMRVVRNICVAAGVVSLVLYFLAPGYVGGFDGTDYRGIYAQKNVLGEAMAFGALAALHGVRSGGQRVFDTAALALFGTVVVMSKSGTSLVAFAGFCAISVLAMLITRGGAARLLAVLLMIVLVPLAVTAAVAPHLFLDFLGKDATLTGRTELWAAVTGYIAQQPIQGWGFQAFWSSLNPAARDVGEQIGWFPSQAHNGLLEMLLEVGVVGTLIYLVILGRTLAVAVRCLTTRHREIGITTLLCCAGLLVTAVSVFVLVDPSDFATPVFFICGLCCERMARASRPAPRRPIYAVRRHG